MIYKTYYNSPIGNLLLTSDVYTVRIPMEYYVDSSKTICICDFCGSNVR